ncbi:MAG: diguanylate cyclase [Anaerostipes sp.]|nr:diguanylate cyclase [Anaerostipes sp.]
MFESAACGICRVLLDENFTLLYANPFYYHIYGYTPENAHSLGFDNARHVIEDDIFEEIHTIIMEHIRKNDRHFEVEYHGLHRSGSSLWLLVRCTYDPAQPDSMICVVMDIAEHKRLEDELRMRIEESRLAFKLTGRITYFFDIKERRLEVPEEAAIEFDMPRTVCDMPDGLAACGIIEEDSLDRFYEFYSLMFHGVPEGSSEIKKRRKDGTVGWYAAKYIMIYDSDHQPKRAIISCEDITEQKEKELIYHKWAQYFKSQEGKTIGYYEYDLSLDRQIEGVGDIPPDYMKDLKKYTETVLYIAEHFVYEYDRERFYRFFDRNRLLTLFYDNQKEVSIEYRRVGQNSVYWVRASIQMMNDPQTDHVKMFMMTINIDEEKRKKIRLQKMVEIDEMTGLLKRETFVRRVNDILGINDYIMRHAFILLDIDEFKQHNDQWGHQYGDQVIRDTAAILKSSLRKNDLCGRLGGDEFIIFLNGIPSQREVMPRIAEICEKLSREIEDRGKVSCSLGVAFYPQDGTDFQQLYQNADIALYKAKQSGRSTYKIFKEDSSSNYDLKE